MEANEVPDGHDYWEEDDRVWVQEEHPLEGGVGALELEDIGEPEGVEDDHAEVPDGEGLGEDGVEVGDVVGQLIGAVVFEPFIFKNDKQCPDDIVHII